MRRVLRGLSYRLRVSIIMVLFAVIPFSIVSMFYLKREMAEWKENSMNEYAHVLAISSERLDGVIQEMELKSQYICNNSSVRATLAKINKMKLADGLDFVNLLRELADSITADNEYLTIRWYPYLSVRDYGEYCYTLDTFKNEFSESDELLERILRLEKGKLLYVVREVDRINDNNKDLKESLCVYVKMSNLNGSECLVEMCMPIENLFEVDNMTLPDGSIIGAYLNFDHDPYVLNIGEKTTSSEVLLQEYYETGECQGYYPDVIEIHSIPDSKMICLYPEEYLNESIFQNLIKYVVIIIFFMVAILMCSYLASTMLTVRVTGSIEKMNKELDSILTNSSITVIKDSDFLGIEQRVRKLIQSTQEYYTKLKQYEIENNRMELELLQMRFNPHFLYNTLTSIRYQIEDEEICKTIDALISYYRIVLSKGRLLIRVEEEIAMIHEFLKVTVLAYGLKNIKYVFDVEDEVKNFMIIKHLLQPIVENALEHGVRANEEGGTICVRARMERNDIIFEIQDDGVGMTSEQMESALTEATSGKQGGGYGIYNVQQRIEVYYGKGYGISFQSKVSEGTCVTLRIPQETKERTYV